MNQRLTFANDLRGLAALSVLVSHFMHNIWVLRSAMGTLANVIMPPEAAVPTPWYIELLGRIPAFDWGGYGVAMFFLVSGLVIPLSIKKYSLAGFLAGRVLRLWPVYAAGFTVSLLSIWIGGKAFNLSFPYSGEQVGIHYVLGLRDLLWFPNIDGVIWTLEIEVKFYVVCALLAWFIRRNDCRMFFVPILIGIASFALVPVMNSHTGADRIYQLLYVFSISAQFIIFMMIGTVFAFWNDRAIKTDRAIAIATVLLGLFLALTCWGPLHVLPVKRLGYIAAIVTFLLYYKLNKHSHRITRFLSDISFPLYASHGMLGYAIIAVMLDKGATPLLAIAAAFACSIATAWALHRCIEAPSHKIGQRIARALTRKTEAASFPA